MIRWKCSNCQVVLRAAENAVGKQLPCPKCHSPQLVPNNSSGPPATNVSIQSPQPHPEPESAPKQTTNRPTIEAKPIARPTQPVESVQPSKSSTVRTLLVAICLSSLLLFGLGIGYLWIGRRSTAEEKLPPAQPDDLVQSGLVDSPEWQQHRQQNRVLSSETANTVSIPAEAGDLSLNLQDVDSLPLSNSDYYGLAGMASQLYRQEGKMVRLSPEQPELTALRGSKHSRTQRLLEQLDKALRRYAYAGELERRATKQEADAVAGLMSSWVNADSQTLVVSEMNMPGVARIESLSEYYTREAIESGFSSLGDRFSAQQLTDEADETRLAIWNELRPMAEKLSASSGPNQPQIQLSIYREQKTDFSGPFETLKQLFRDKQLWIYGLRATNRSNQDLRNVTLVVTLDAIPSFDVHPDQVDAALQEPNHYFIRHWPAKGTLQLLTGQHWGSDGLRRSFRGHVSIYSEQARIEKAVIELDENLRNYGQECLSQWNRSLDNGQHESVLRQIEVLGGFIPERISDLRSQIAELRTVAELSRQKLAKLKSLFSSGHEFQGTWSFGKFQGPMSARVTTSDPAAAANQDANSFAIELFQPDQPSKYRRLAGNVVCRNRVWQIQLVKTNFGVDSTGVTASYEFFPTSDQILDREGPNLSMHLSENGSEIFCRSNRGDLLQMVPVAIPPAAAPIVQLNTQLLTNMYRAELGTLPPLPAECFSSQPLTTGSLVIPSATVGEFARGQADSDGLYSIEQIVLANDQPRALSRSRKNEMHVWNLDDAPAPTGSKPQKTTSDSDDQKPPLLPGQLDSGSINIVLGQMAVAPDFALMASATEFGRVRFQDFKTKKNSESDLSVSSMRFSRFLNQSILAAITHDQAIRVWNEKGKVLLQQTLPIAASTLNCSHDGSLVAVAVDSKLMIWSLLDQRLLTTKPYVNVAPREIHFSADASKMMLIGSTVASGSTLDGKGAPNPLMLVVMDIASGQELYRQPIHSSLCPFAISLDWSTLLVADPSGPILVWNLKQGTLGTVLVGHRRPVASLALSSDGRYAASGGSSKDTYALFWRIDR